MTWSAKKAELVNVGDCYHDPRFDVEDDRRQTRNTKTMLCVPVLDSSGLVMGVVQVTNKGGASSAAFTDEDIQLMQAIATLASVTVQNSYHFERTQEACSKMGELGSMLADRVNVPYVCQRLAHATGAHCVSAIRVMLVCNGVSIGCCLVETQRKSCTRSNQ